MAKNLNVVMLNGASPYLIRKGGGSSSGGGGSTTPTDGKTRLYIEIAAKGRMDVPLYISQTISEGVTIDWGDGSTQTLSGTGNVNTTHNYADIGKYTITLDAVEGCVLGLGHGSSYYCVIGSTGSNGIVYCNMLQRVEIGNGVTSIGNYAFYNCPSLSSVVIPNNVTMISRNAFFKCQSLSSIVIPDSVTSIGDYAFQSCSSLSSVVIPDSVTRIGSSAFNDCPSLSSVVIPDSVTSIGSNAFSGCYGMAYYDFSTHTSVPTLSATNAFNYIPSDCKIVVPDALYDEWIAATNWSTYASKIVKASEFNF